MASPQALMRTPAFLRAGVLIVIGLVVTFTAPLHSMLEFNRGLFGISVLALGIVQVIVFAVAKLRPYLPRADSLSSSSTSLQPLSRFSRQRAQICSPTWSLFGRSVQPLLPS